MIEQELSWVGLQVGDFRIDQKLGEGIFSSVYLGSHLQTAERKVFKVAKTPDSVSNANRENSLATRAIAKITGGTMDVLPNPASLLRKQYAQLKSVSDSGWIKVDQLVDQPGLTYYRMDFVEGETLRQSMTRQSLTVDQTIALARSLAKLNKSDLLPFHGDIKAENILLTEYGITVIDPGYFGRLDLVNGSNLADCAITTVAYYPTLEPDDVMAFGLLLWEIVLGVQPTAQSGYSLESDLSRIGKNLLESVRLQEMVGRYFLSSILNVPLPSSLQAQIGSELESLLLKSIRLKKTADGKIDLDPGFRSFAAIAGALAALRIKGTDRFLSK